MPFLLQLGNGLKTVLFSLEVGSQWFLVEHCKQSNKDPTDSWSTFPQRVGRIWYDLVTHGMLSCSRTARPTKGNLPIGLCSSLSLFKYLLFLFWYTPSFVCRMMNIWPIPIQMDDPMRRGAVREDTLERLGCTTAHIGLLRSLDPSIRSVS